VRLLNRLFIAAHLGNTFERQTALASASTIAIGTVLAVPVDYGLPYLVLVIAWGWIGWRVLRMPAAEWASLRERPHGQQRP
jgi:hypothetical protein